MSHLGSFGPAVAKSSPVEALRAGLGAFIGLALAGAFVLAPTIDLALGLYLVAPFGASSVLLFAVPNSPLAQPWSAIIGNVIAALVGVAVCLVVQDPVLRIALAVGLAITVTILCRALHPPAGAVAMTVAMSPDAVQELGFYFALMPIGIGTVVLVLIAMIYGRMTGRHYPFRQFDDLNRYGTQDLEPMKRLGLSEAELSDILDRYKQSFNLGVEDLARLLGAAEMQVAAHRSGPTVASDIMSHNLITVQPETPLAEIADLFRRYRFTALPVVGREGRFLGVIFQIHLIDRAREDSLRLKRGFGNAIHRLLDRRREIPVQATDIMSVGGPRAIADTPLSALLPQMADGAVDAVPVLERGQLIGIVTRTDLISALARKSLDK
ncbi:MAG TPA: CBS domain-containing protein [Sulfitobacter litoralis]|uniref:CBS domain-containing protein n=1 Tax=Sulfitobacter litoralis TaxID=335975 RepID=A0A7V1FM37_9RHOB|nr:HPP family protein [Sulfitobacter litoralis]HDZ51182.1 CBS domain-containing protein [Sulfitobacter litoralis]